MIDETPAAIAQFISAAAWVKVTNPVNGSSWTGRMIAYAPDPSVIIDRADGFRVCLPASFRIEPAEPVTGQPNSEPENTCGNPHCDGKCHAPAGQERPFPPSTPEWRAQALSKGIGAK